MWCCCAGRSGSSTSTEDLSSPIQNDSTASNKDDVSIASAQSISNASNDNEEEERLMPVDFKYVMSLCTALVLFSHLVPARCLHLQVGFQSCCAGQWASVYYRNTIGGWSGTHDASVAGAGMTWMPRSWWTRRSSCVTWWWISCSWFSGGEWRGQPRRPGRWVLSCKGCY